MEIIETVKLYIMGQRSLKKTVGRHVDRLLKERKSYSHIV